MFAAVLVQGEILSNTLLILAAVSMGGFSSNHWAFTQYLSGPEAAGKWTGFENCLGNFAGVVAPWLTGWALGVTHSFFTAFAIACGILLVGVLGYWFVVGRPERVTWDRTPNSSEFSEYSKEAART
jgi:MFS-type transporter involved in bile tolerance (Atg22 family)